MPVDGVAATPAEPTGRGARSFWRDLSLPAVVAGFVAVLVGYTSLVVIVFEAARSLGADAAQITSWMPARWRWLCNTGARPPVSHPPPAESSLTAVPLT